MNLIVMDTLIIAVIIAGIGGALSAFLGWLDSSEPFDARKFSSGIIRGAIAGAVLATSIEVDITTRTLILLFFSALGFDVAINKVVKSVKREQKRRS